MFLSIHYHTLTYSLFETHAHTSVHQVLKCSLSSVSVYVISCNDSCGVARAGGGAQLKFMVHPCRSWSVTACNGGPYEVDGILKEFVFVDNKRWLQVIECDFSGALESRVDTALMLHFIQPFIRT